MKKIVALIAFALIVATVAALPAFAAEQSFGVSLRIEGKTENVYYGQVTTGSVDDFNVIKLLARVDRENDDLEITGLENGYITAINQVKAGQTAKGFDGYVVRVNGEYVPYSELGFFKLEAGDEIIVYYSDEFESGIITEVIVDTERIDQGYIKFTYEKPYSDGKYVSSEALVGATVRWYCGEAEFVYTTDGQGGIIIDKAALTSGEHKMSIELYHGNGAPAVLRFAPDYTVKVPVAIGDTNLVYACAIAAAVSLGAAVLLAISLKKRV